MRRCSIVTGPVSVSISRTMQFNPDTWSYRIFQTNNFRLLGVRIVGIPLYVEVQSFAPL